MLGTALSTLLRLTAAQQVAQEARGLAGRLVLRVSVALVAAVCVAASFGCGLAALWIYATPRTSPALAALIVAALLLFIAGALLLSLRLPLRLRRPAAPQESFHQSSSSKNPSSASGVLPELLHGDGSALLVAAILAGLILGTKSARGKREP